MNKTYLPYTQSMATWVKDARAKLDISQQEISTKLKYTQTFLSQLERGKAKKVCSKRWARVHAFFVEKGIAPISAESDPVKNQPDVKKLKKSIDAIKKTSGSWKQVAEMLGVHASTLTNFNKGEKLGMDTLVKLKEAVDKLTALPQQLADAGHIAQPKPARAEKIEKAEKKTRAKSLGKKPVIHTTDIPTPEAIRLRLAEVCRKERMALEGLLTFSESSGFTMNGSTHKFIGV